MTEEGTALRRELCDILKRRDYSDEASKRVKEIVARLKEIGYER